MFRLIIKAATINSPDRKTATPIPWRLESPVQIGSTARRHTPAKNPTNHKTESHSRNGGSLDDFRASITAETNVTTIDSSRAAALSNPSSSVPAINLGKHRCA